MTKLSIDPQLARAETPASEWYLSPELLAIEKERVFRRTWQLVGLAERVAKPGGYFIAELGGEPILVARGGDGVLRAMSNVCRHRAGPVAAGEGERKAFQCGYHGWTYTLEGRLIHARELGAVECFDKELVCLPSFKVATWGPLVFACLDPAAPALEDVLEDLPNRVGDAARWTQMKPAFRKTWTVECNWKTYVDNYLEGYHIPFVHPSLNRELDYAAYWTETKRWHSIQHAPYRKDAPGRLGGAGEPGARAVYAWLFPNLMINMYPDNFSTNLIIPESAERTSMVFEWFFEDPDERRVRDTVAMSDEIQLEDIKICETVQRGLRSKTYRAGRYSVERENGVHHFHRLLAECLA